MPFIPLLFLAWNGFLGLLFVVLFVVGFAIWAISALVKAIKKVSAQERAARLHAALSKRWAQDFPVPYPDTVGRVTFDPDRDAETSFDLVIPHWEHARNDGTRDGRYSSTTFYYGGSAFTSGPWKVTSSSPLRIVGLVRQMRDAGIEVTPHRWKSEKGIEQTKVARYGFPIRSAEEIVDTYEYDPYGFERFCVYLYKKLGYTGGTTKKSADGGYDFLVEKDGEKTIGECKLYGKSTTVGRPDLQKLYGANAIMGAEHMVFITTNVFTPEAKKYARSAGIELIDRFGIKSLQHRAKAACAKKGEEGAFLWEPLTEQDVIARTPYDLRDEL